MKFAAVIALALLLGVVFVGDNVVLADSCSAQLNYSTTYSNGQIIVPVSASCSFNGGQLYAVGYAVDSFGRNLGSTSTLLTSINGGNEFSGQLVFTSPFPAQGGTVQVSVSIYSNGPNGTILTSTTQTLQVNGAYYSPGTNWYYPWYYPWYNSWYPSYPSYPSYSPPSPPHHHYDDDHPHYNGGYSPHYNGGYNSHSNGGYTPQYNGGSTPPYPHHHHPTH